MKKSILNTCLKIGGHHTDYPKLNLNKGDGIFILNNKEVKFLNLNEEDKKFIKPTYKNSDVRKWYFTPSKKLFVLYLKDEGLPIKLSNNLQSHFEKYKPILVRKKMNCFKNTWLKKIVEPWLTRGNYFVLFYPRDKKIFDNIKIVNSRRSKTNSFSLEDRRMYEQSDLMITTLKSQFKDKIDIKYILSILNSKLYYYWFYKRGKRKGNQLELFQKPLSEVPIKVFNQKLFIALVDKILEAKKQDPNANTSSREKQLDIMVYHLYNLTYDEAKIIDAELSEEEFEKYKM